MIEWMDGAAIFKAPLFVPRALLYRLSLSHFPLLEHKEGARKVNGNGRLEKEKDDDDDDDEDDEDGRERRGEGGGNGAPPHTTG